jgi:hypothetical protein
LAIEESNAAIGTSLQLTGAGFTYADFTADSSLRISNKQRTVF